MEPVTIRPRGPKAIVGILLRGYYSTEGERLALIRALLSGRPDPEQLEGISKLLTSELGRRRLGAKAGSAISKLVEWAPAKECLLVYVALPITVVSGRLALLRRAAELRHALVNEPEYRGKFAGRMLSVAEYKLLVGVLGQEVLVERLVRPLDQKHPPLRIAAG